MADLAPLVQGRRGTGRLDVKIMPIDVLHAASILHKLVGTRTAIQNFSDEQVPGGMFLKGARRQEDSICVRTTLYYI